jgi:hypothetical protein
MKLVGDPDGISALKELVGAHRDYLKFLLGEAQSNTDHAAPFKGNDGTRWRIILHPESGEVEICRAEL